MLWVRVLLLVLVLDRLQVLGSVSGSSTSLEVRTVLNPLLMATSSLTRFRHDRPERAVILTRDPTLTSYPLGMITPQVPSESFFGEPPNSCSCLVSGERLV